MIAGWQPRENKFIYEIEVGKRYEVEETKFTLTEIGTYSETESYFLGKCDDGNVVSGFVNDEIQPENNIFKEL